jgi:hypothetical protein
LAPRPRDGEEGDHESGRDERGANDEADHGQSKPSARIASRRAAHAASTCAKAGAS